MSTDLSSATIRCWVEAVRGKEIPTGPGVDEATRRAEVTWARLREGEPPAFSARDGSEAADEIHALCALIGREQDPTEGGLRSVTLLYGAVEQLSWPDDELGEKGDLLARISYIAWLHARRLRTYSQLEVWEGRVAGHALDEESVKAFFAIPAQARSDALNFRFLGDPAVLLTACVRLRRLIETAPVVGLNEADLARKWLIENWRALGSAEESAYFAAELGLIVAAGTKHCGRYQECRAWLDLLEAECDRVQGGESLRARISYLRLAVSYELRSYREVIEALPKLKEAFKQLGMHSYFAKSCLLEANTLKELGREAEALLAFEAVKRDPCIQRECSLNALVLIGTAELEGRIGRFGAAEADLLDAWNLLRGSGTPFSIGHFHAVSGELLRDQGLLEAAASSYRAGVAVYSTAGMASLAAYLRIVLAETLLAAGREEEAVFEIAAALPTISESQLVHEAMAAIALLRESVRRRKLDPAVLHELREQLERMKNRGEL